MAANGDSPRMLTDDILFLSVRELGQRIRTKQISPVELTESYLARSSKLDPQVHAYVTITHDLALSQARQAETEISAGNYRGSLHGIPYAAKDLLAVKGYKTTWGARPFRDQTFDFNATVIEKLNAAGAILIGKAAMIELAGGMGYRYASASLTGAAKNPWNTSYWTGGSSSGPGAIVSAALAAFAIGTETWGSILCPSAFCGVSGLRPTFGRVSRHGAMTCAYSLDKIGPMARTADDCALVLSVIAGHDPLDRSSLPEDEGVFLYAPASNEPRHPAHGSAHPSPPPELRIGWLTNAWEKPTPEIATATRSAVELLQRNGTKLSDAKLPEGPYETAAGTILSVECAAAFRKFILEGRAIELADPLGRIGGYVNEQISASDHIVALQIREICQQRIDKLFDDFDVIAAASLPVPATRIDANIETELAFPDPLGGIGNLCGLPAISIPCGFTASNLPIGLQFLARARNDRALIDIANLFQLHTQWCLLRPPLA
jgi:aspartyl-tRNA(Asn)/glutamyl-tRNA(Gln) amidotransferase subunit A